MKTPDRWHSGSPMVRCLGDVSISCPGSDLIYYGRVMPFTYARMDLLCAPQRDVIPLVSDQQEVTS
jgi:hypothetical protein